MAIYVMLAIWSLLLIPWMFFALLGTGMAFEGGKTVDAYYFLFTIWSYPCFVAAAFLFRRRHPKTVILPGLSGLLAVFENAVHKATSH